MSGSIANFNMSDGIPPLLMQKLNNNFRTILESIEDPEVNIVSGATAPDPRTDETLWYNTETGELSIWARVIDLTTGEPKEPPEWAWKSVGLDLVQVGDGDPSFDNVPPKDSFLYYEAQSKMLWIYQRNGGANVATWAPFNEAVGAVLYYDWLRPGGQFHNQFVDAVRAAIA